MLFAVISIGGTSAQSESDALISPDSTPSSRRSAADKLKSGYPLASIIDRNGSDYFFIRCIFIRLLALLYFVAFLVLMRQAVPLIGYRGLLPADLYLDAVRGQLSSGFRLFWEVPSLFWWRISDAVLRNSAYAGLGLSVLAFLGFGNGIVLFLLWFLYLSFVNVGQIFYGYGWESLLLETGFLAIFAVPLFRSDLSRASPPPFAVVVLFRWLLFRVMFGAGTIKLRGDSCWWDLTCLAYHYETQPLPNPLSWYFHQLPLLAHKYGVAFNHFVELFIPWLYFAPRRRRIIAGICTIVFQFVLILSGNLSWLNWLTIALSLFCLDDAFLLRMLRRTAASIGKHAPSPSRLWATRILVAMVLFLSINPALNLVALHQVMNASFDPFHLVNTYGAFGSIGRERYEIVLEGSDDEYASPRGHWKEYEFKCKPGRVDSRPCIVAPYQLRLDWQIWFAAMSSFQRNPWLIHLVAKLLAGDKAVLSLLEEDPFPGRPPRYLRAILYRYTFTKSFSDKAWWSRSPAATYFAPITLEHPALMQYLRQRGWDRRLKLRQSSSAI